MPMTESVLVKLLERDREHIKKNLEKPWRIEIKDVLREDLASVERRLDELRHQQASLP